MMDLSVASCIGAAIDADRYGVARAADVGVW